MAMTSLANEFWTWRLTESPEYAYKLGVTPPVEGAVEEFTEAAFQRRKVIGLVGWSERQRE